MVPITPVASAIRRPSARSTVFSPELFFVFTADAAML